jgi:hypothetical protein
MRVGVIVAVIEVVFTDQYQRYVDVISYYIAKRATPEEQSTFHDTRLFVSAIRPETRMFAFPLRRLAGLVDFPQACLARHVRGNRRLLRLAVGDEISRGRGMVCLTFACILVILCDGRLAFGLIIVALAAGFVVFRLPKLVLVLYFALGSGNFLPATNECSVHA